MSAENDLEWSTACGDRVRVSASTVDVTANNDQLVSGTSDQGAVVTFSGRMRGTDAGESVQALYLEHYPAMTRRTLDDLITRVRTHWPLGRIVLEHRIGWIHPEETIVFVGVTATHRAPAFDACDSLMDWVKTEAPFWKKAFTDRGEHWVASKSTDQQRAARWTR